MRLAAGNRRLHVLALVLACGCAKPFSPPGGVQDRTPPRLVSTEPAALAVVPQLDRITFTFDETLSERGVNDAVVAVSPQPRGKVHVERHGNRIDVVAAGGFQRDQIYRVVIQPGVSDRFGNARKDPAEIVFSTGPPIQNTALAGLILDRLTGRGAAEATVEAVRRADSATYVARADSISFFALRSVPAGVYDVRAYSDLNRNRRLDRSEPSSRARQVNLGASDTIALELTVVPFDTTPPVLARAAVTDSMHVLLTFDDPIDPDSGLTGVSYTFV